MNDSIAFGTRKGTADEAGVAGKTGVAGRTGLAGTGVAGHIGAAREGDLRGDRDDVGDDYGRPLRPFRRLTPEEAALVRAANPPVSPWRVVLAQAAAGLLCSTAAWLFGREPAWAWSALYGVAAAVLPSALLARGMTRGTRGAVAAAAGFMFWEMLKIGVAIAMLLIAAKVVPRLSWPVLLATMVVCIKVNWVALLWRGR